MNKHLIRLGVAAILVCALAVLAVTITGLKEYRETLRTGFEICVRLEEL